MIFSCRIKSDFTQPVIMALDGMHARTMQQCNLCRQTVHDIWAQLLLAIDALCINVLEDDTFGCTDVLPCDILVHLQTNCGQPSPGDVKANRNTFSIGTQMTPLKTCGNASWMHNDLHRWQENQSTMQQPCVSLCACWSNLACSHWPLTNGTPNQKPTKPWPISKPTSTLKTRNNCTN